MEQERDCFGFYRADSLARSLAAQRIGNLAARLQRDEPLDEGEQIAEIMAEHGAGYTDSVGYWH